MGVITASTLTSGSASGSGATTASISPAVNSLILVGVTNQKGSTPSPLTPSISGSSMTWTQVSTYNPTDDYRLTVFRALSSSPGSGALTIANCDSSSEIVWCILQLKNVAVTGTNGADAVVQSAQAFSNNNASSLTTTLSAFQKNSNAAVGFIAGQNLSGVSGFSSGSGFTSMMSQTRIHAEFKDTQDTTVDWTWSTSTFDRMAIALEIKSAIRGGAFLFNLT